jgi:hypothetical protein
LPAAGRPDQQQKKRPPQGPLSEAEPDTEHVFGFTEGSELGRRGEVEGEADTTGRFGKQNGYSAVSTAFRLKYSPSDDFRITPGFAVARHDIAGSPDLDGRGQWAFEGVGLELKYRLLNNKTDPFGLTIGVTPGWGTINPTTGERADVYGLDFSVVMDRELVDGRLYGGLNFFYEPEWSRLRATGEWQHRSTVTVAGALSYRLGRSTFFGLEGRYMRAYDSISLSAYAGNALFIGPSFYTRFSERVGFLVAWNAQAIGKAVGQAGALDLANFERHQVRMQFTMKLVP